MYNFILKLYGKQPPTDPSITANFQRAIMNLKPVVRDPLHKTNNHFTNTSSFSLLAGASSPSHSHHLCLSPIFPYFSAGSFIQFLMKKPRRKTNSFRKKHAFCLWFGGRFMNTWHPRQLLKHAFSVYDLNLRFQHGRCCSAKPARLENVLVMVYQRTCYLQDSSKRPVN